MPYIDSSERPLVDPLVDDIVQDLSHHDLEEKRAQHLAYVVSAFLKNRTYRLTRGQYNYVLTEVTVRSLELNTDPCYDRLNDALGAIDYARSLLQDLLTVRNRGILRCVELELYRRLISIYENDKIELNGDIDCYSHLPTPTNGGDQ